MIHEINLKSYQAVCDSPNNLLDLGTSGSYGIEQLHVTADSAWDGLVLTAVFTNGASTEVPVVSGVADVPPEATAYPTHAGRRFGRIVFKGCDADGAVRLISNALLYTIADSGEIDGENTIAPTPDQYAQFVAEVTAEADRAEAAANRAESAGSTVTPEQIAEAVNSYLDENPVQPTAIDATLTQSGQAADAAVVGNRLSTLSEEIVTTAESKVSAHNTGTDTHSDIRLLIQGLTDRLNALADSDDATLDQLSEVVAYIKSNRELISAITTDKVSVADIVNNLTTNVANKPLSAAQGVALKALIDAISVPDKLPNPNALTFTGAVTGSYDGSEPVTVEIPSGGSGGSDAWNLIEHFTVADAAISYAIPLQPGAKEYGIYWTYTNASGSAPKRSIMVDSSLAQYGVMYRCTTNETLFLRVFKGPSNILATGQGVGYSAQRFSNGGTNIGSGTDFPAMTLTTDIACATSEIWVYWR